MTRNAIRTADLFATIKANGVCSSQYWWVGEAKGNADLLVDRKSMPVLYLLFGLCLVSTCLAAKIVMLPMFGRSHYMVMAKLGTELVNRGHKVQYNNCFRFSFNVLPLKALGHIRSKASSFLG